MAQYTVTTNAAQDSALTYLVGQENARRAALVPPLPAITNQQYLDGITDAFLTDYVRQWRRANAVAKLTAATPTVPTAAEIAALGLS